MPIQNSKLLLLLLICFAAHQRVAADFRDGLHNFARQVQSGSGVYDFDGKKVAVNISSLLSHGISNDCFTKGTTNTGCQYIQGLGQTVIVCLLIALITLLVFFFWCCGRCCCRCIPSCCCYSCGYREPQFTEYSKPYTLVNAGVMLVFLIFLIIFAALGLAASQSITSDLDGVRDSVINFINTLEGVTNSITNFVSTSSASLISSVDSISATFSFYGNNLGNDKTQLQVELANVGTGFTNFPQQASCTGCAAQKTALSNAASAVSNFQNPNTTFSISGDSIQNQINGATGFLSTISDFNNQLDSTKTTVTNDRSDFSPYENDIKAVLDAFCASVWFAVFLMIVALALRKTKPLFYAGFVCSWFPAVVGWILFGVLYVISDAMSSTCDVIPYRGEDPSSPTIFSSLSGAQLQQTGNAFAQQCVMINTGSFFVVFNVNTSSFTNTITGFSLSKQVNLTAITTVDTSPLNQSATATAAVLALTPQILYGSNYATLSASDQTAVAAHLTAVQASAVAPNSRVQYMQGNVSAMQGAVPTVNNNLNAVLSTVNQNFLALDSGCATVGSSFTDVRSSICDGVLKSFDAMWVCIIIIAVILHWTPIPLFKLMKELNPKSKDLPPDGTQLFAISPNNEGKNLSASLVAPAGTLPNEPQTWPPPPLNQTGGWSTLPQIRPQVISPSDSVRQESTPTAPAPLPSPPAHWRIPRKEDTSPAPPLLGGFVDGSLPPGFNDQLREQQQLMHMARQQQQQQNPPPPLNNFGRNSPPRHPLARGPPVPQYPMPGMNSPGTPPMRFTPPPGIYQPPPGIYQPPPGIYQPPPMYQPPPGPYQGSMPTQSWSGAANVPPMGRMRI